MRSFAVTVALLLPAGCGAGAFACSDDVDCNNAGVAGTCEPGGGCSFPDDRCPSGKRYGEHAPGGLGGDCVPPGAGSSETTGASVGSTGASATTTIGTLEGGATTSTGGTGDAVTTDPDSSGSGDATDPSQGTTGDGPAEFFDAFDRADSDALDNGWIEKSPGVFRIEDEHVELERANGGNFRDNICYRPLDESMLDVEVTLVFSYDDALEIGGYPQLHLRVQESSLGELGVLDSYAVFIDTAEAANPLLTVNRIAGAGFGDSSSTPVEIGPGVRYRLRGRVFGTDPVTIEGYLELDTGFDWEGVAETMLVDASMTRLSEPGTVGLSGHEDLSTLALDDFGYTRLEP